MSLGELRIENLRCIESAALEFSPELNLIAGENGAGKTSILEAIFLLGRGRSFRTRSAERLVRHGRSALTVFGRTQDLPPKAAGIEVSREGTRARVNGENVQTLLELSGVLPVQAIDPDIHKLIEHGPERRRRWLDWLVFHVEPSFAPQWARYQRALKQRNAALKAGQPGATSWDAVLVEAGEAISGARASALRQLEPYLDRLFGAFSGLAVQINFNAGWPPERTLQDQLRTNLERDRERGLTHGGPHRADVELRIKGRAAREVLSRGQQKLTAVAMIVSQLQLLRAQLGMRATLLLDDPAAELDAKNLARLFDELTALKCQMIATSLTPETALFQAPKATFHVEQGRVIRL
jgi:DNA replication and repair protein RecF